MAGEQVEKTEQATQPPPAPAVKDTPSAPSKEATPKPLADSGDAVKPVDATKEASKNGEPAPADNPAASESKAEEKHELPGQENGEKLAAEDVAPDRANENDYVNDDEAPPAKRQKTDETPAAKKGPGRPKRAPVTANGATKKTPAKKREPRPAATPDGVPRRSARIRSG